MCVHTLYMCVYIHIDKAYMRGMCARIIYIQYIYKHTVHIHTYICMYVRVRMGKCLCVCVCMCLATYHMKMCLTSVVTME